MSKYAGAILTIVGTVVGAFFGGPLGASIGAVLGGLVGSLAFPQNNSTTGPRLADIASTTSSVGVGMPRGWGTFVVAGNFIAQSDLREVMVTTESGGKGPPAQTTTTPTYYQDFAIGLTDTGSPESRRLVKGVRTIWANGKTIYDRRPQGDAEETGAYQQRLAASDKLQSAFTFYTGSDDQLPDPTLEAFYGIGNISAFRGLSYIVFENWQNKSEDGNRIPAQWLFELYTDGDESGDTLTEYTNEVLYGWGGDPPMTLAGDQSGSYGYISNGGSDGASADNLPDAIAKFGDVGGSGLQYLDYSLPADVVTGTMYGTSKTGDGNIIGTVGFEDPVQVLLHYNAVIPQQFIAGPPPSGICEIINAVGQPLPIRVSFADRWFETGGAVYGISGSCGSLGECDPRYIADPTFIRQFGYDALLSCGGIIGPGGGIEFDTLEAYDRVIILTRSPVAPPDPCDASSIRPTPMSDGSAPPEGDARNPTTIPGLDGYVLVNGELRQCGPWAKTAGTWHVLQAYTVDTSEPLNHLVTKYPMGPARPVGHAQYDDEAFWTAAYEVAVARHKMKAGLVYGTDYPVAQGYGYERTTTQKTTTTLPALCSDIVREIGIECSYSPDDLDVTDIESLTVAGYIRTGQMTGRSAIAPLCQIKFFDGIESLNQIKFVRRGKDITFALRLDDDLGCVVAGSDRIPQIQTQDADETTIPRSVTVAYLSPSRDYGTGSQVSPTTLQTTSVTDLNVTFPGILSDDEAKAAATRLWAIGRTEAVQYQSTVDGARQELEQTDCGTLPLDGLNQRVRITAIADSLPITRALTMVRDDSLAYTPTPVASVPPYEPQPINLAAPVTPLFLDLPAIQDSDDDPGFYVAFRSQLEGAYRGAALFRSIDSGASYQQVCAATNEATTGTLLMPDGTADFDTWDAGNEVRVELSSGQLASTTQEAVLNGANALAVGLDGRWEIIQFTTAVLISGNVWRCKGLLRGRRGTEQFIGTSVTGDSVVLISGPGIVRANLPITGVGRPYLYRGVATGMSLDQALDVTFIGNATALKPFSPADLNGSQDLVSDDWTITWLRRSRIGATLQSGVDVALHEDYEDYELQILDGSGAVLRTISTSLETVDYSHDQQITDFGVIQTDISVAVRQVSAQVGLGYPTFGSFSRAVIVPPGIQTSTLQVVFGGMPTAAEESVIELFYRPNVGGLGSYFVFDIAGGSPNGPSTHAADLAAQMTTALAGLATVTHVVDNVTAISTTGVLDARSAFKSLFSAGLCDSIGHYSVQTSSAPAITNEGFYGVDLYDVAGLAPGGTDARYSVAGTYVKKFNIRNLDADLQQQFIQANSAPGSIVPGEYCFAPQVLATVEWFLGAHSGAGERSLTDVFSGDGVSGIAEAIMAHPVLGPIVDSVAVTGSRPCVEITLKDGWALATDDASIVIGDPEPCGFSAETSLIFGGDPVKAYPLGRAQIDTFTFQYQQSPYTGQVLSPPTDIAVGQTLRVTLNGTNFDHIVDSTDLLDDTTGTALEPSFPHYLDRAYGDIAAQINATGTYQVTLEERPGRTGSPSDFVQSIAVRSTAPNSAYAVSATVLPEAGLTITITTSITH